MTITDAPALALLIGAAVLLFPELTILEIPGVVRLEREVQDQGRRQDEIIRQIQNMNVLAQSQQITISLLGSIAQLPEKDREFKENAPGPQ
jgi:hypothetical protein